MLEGTYDMIIYSSVDQTSRKEISIIVLGKNKINFLMTSILQCLTVTVISRLFICLHHVGVSSVWIGLGILLLLFVIIHFFLFIAYKNVVYASVLFGFMIRNC